MVINEYVKDFRGRSFYMENELICGMIMFFFQTSLSGWVSLSINEGEAIFTQEKSEPLLLALGEINDEFAYPMETIFQLSNYIGKKIVNIYEYKIKNVENGCVGTYFECDVGGFSILEENGCLSIVNGLYDGFKEEVFLYEIDKFNS